MFSRTSVLAFLLACQQYGVAAAPTWPASTDELEDILYLNSGYRSRGFATPVTPCSKGVTAGRITAAEWVRTAFHDAISGNIYSGEGGLDGSIAFELTSSENAGNAFPSSVGMWAPFLSGQTSFADIVAAAIYTATRSCGGPIIPIRGGRVDATTAGPQGFIPQPQNAIGTFRNQFARLGLDNTGMIQLVACGHSLGGVHASENPLILDSGTAPNDFATMDSTPSTFDSKIASEYMSGTTKDPLVVGKSVSTKRNSDAVVFSSDRNVTIAAMQDAARFSSTCRSLFQKMIEVIPSGVTLTDPVTPYEVKPYDVQLTLLAGGTKIKFTGDVRIRTTQRANIAQVQLIYKDRTGASVSSQIATTLKGTASGFDDSFAFFGFSTELTASTSISSFTVAVTAGGATQTFDNNGNGFKVDDTVIFQSPQSCLGASGKLTVVAAVRDDASTPNLQVVVKNPRASPNPVPSLSTATAAMASQSAVGSYKLYSADYTLSGSQSSSAQFGVFAGSSSDKLKSTSNLPTACSPLGSSTPTSTPTPTAAAFQGCYYDAGAPRALTGTASFDETITVEKCASFCSSYQYFGLEYGRECYCGNTLDATSTIRALSDCNMPCGGDATQTCGAGNRMSLYKNTGYSPPVNPEIPGYSYKGCYSEGSAGRALGDSATNSDRLTVDSCATFCDGTKYFGVEYGKECYCGATLGAGSEVQPATNCNMLCAGNSTEYCGAGNRLNLYQKLGASTTPTPTPTPSVSSSSTSLSSSSSTTPTPTPSSSPSPSPSPSSSSTSSPSPSASTSSTTTPTSTPTPTPTPSPSADSNSPSPSPTTTPSSTSLTSSTPTPTPSGPSLTGYNYVGCLTDEVANRALVGQTRNVQTNSYASCASFCSGYQYFGVEYGSECYCGNILEYTTPHPESSCTMPCSGDSTSICGGPSLMNVFNSTRAVQLPQNPDIANYTYKGCYTDSVNARVLADDHYFDADMTVEKCAANCKGSRFFGAQYGAECYCGRVMQGSSEKRPETECRMVCGGDDMEYCGNGNRLTLYEKDT